MNTLKITNNEDVILDSLIRERAGLRESSFPIKVIDGFGPPILQGRRQGFETKGGWGDTVYRINTRHILVGAGWLTQECLTT